MKNILPIFGYKAFVETYFPIALQARFLLARAYRRETAFQYLHSYIPTERNSIDIGANRGIYTRFLAKRTRHVYAYEPNTGLEPYLRTSMPRNVSVNLAALSDCNGQRNLYIPIGEDGRDLKSIAKLGDNFEEEHSGRVRQMRIPVRTLDSECLNNIGFIKIDVEGFEWDVIRGAQNLIARDRPVIFCEVEQRHLDYPMVDFFTYMADLGYHAVFFDYGTMHDIDDFSIERHQIRPAPGSKEPIQPYINNFLFLPKKREGQT